MTTKQKAKPRPADLASQPQTYVRLADGTSITRYGNDTLEIRRDGAGVLIAGAVRSEFLEAIGAQDKPKRPKSTGTK